MEKVEYLKRMHVLRQRGGNGSAFTHRENIWRGVEV